MFVVVPFVAASDEPSVRAFVAKARQEAGAEAVVSNYVMTHYNALVALNMFMARTQGPSLVQVQALGELAPDPGCK